MNSVINFFIIYDCVICILWSRENFIEWIDVNAHKNDLQKRRKDNFKFVNCEKTTGGFVEIETR